mgnify:CR=1 FL=1
MALKLTPEQKTAIIDLAEWLSVTPEKLLEKMIVNQIDYCNQIKTECWQNQRINEKYELAAQLRLLEWTTQGRELRQSPNRNPGQGQPCVRCPLGEGPPTHYNPNKHQNQ